MKFEVFRCNQFYFEDKYYLGKQIKGYSAALPFISTYSVLNLLARGEYELEKFFLYDNHLGFIDKNNQQIQNTKQTIDVLSHYLHFFNHNQSFIDRAYNGSFSHNIAEFLEWNNLAGIYYRHHITSGVLSCALAVAMGHREIYIAGIDFYDSAMGAHYFTGMGTPNMRGFTDLFSEDDCDEQGLNYKADMEYHKKAADIEGLYFLQEAYGVKFYSLCESSPISELIPLAKKTNNTFAPTPKPKDYICDFCIPAQESFNFAKVQQARIQQIAHLKQNIYFRLLWDLSRIPKHIKLYIKGKIAKEQFKKQMKKLEAQNATK